MTHKDLVEISYKWVLKNASCGIAFKELVSTDREIPDVIGFNSWSSIVIECKVSRGDFLKDKKKPHRAKGMGAYRYYSCPTGLIKKEELPPKWGLIYVNEKGKATCIYNPVNDRGKYIGTNENPGAWEKDNSFERDISAEQRIMYTALRRLFIKGFVKHIYDKQYNRTSNVNELILFNET